MEVTSWTSWKEFQSLDNKAKSIFNELGEIDDISISDDYQNIWNRVNLDIQINKAKQHGLSLNQTRQCLSQLSRRPFYLSKLADFLSPNSIVEVGTAQGLQSISFAYWAKNNNPECKVYTCDIKDVRNKDLFLQYKNNLSFTLGNSQSLKSYLFSENKKVDLFYVDGAHDKGDVLKDVETLKPLQSEYPCWIFDDVDTRFGCYEDIVSICKKSGNFKVYRVGNACSGKPNHQAIVLGKI